MFRVRDCYPLRSDFPDGSTTQHVCNSVRRPALLYLVPRPLVGNAAGLSHQPGLGSSAFARRYLRSRCYFPFLGLLRCFNSPGSLYPPYIFRRKYYPITSSGFPHSDILGSKSGRRLPEAYRSLPRPSSVVDAKASTVGPL